MTFEADPYRTLGLAPGASLNEIRSAYRRLAKQYHPDAAGNRALPRFLAIRAAYELLVDGEGQPAWQADPERARASREAWRARRGGGSNPGAGARTGAGAGPEPGGGSGPGPRRGAGAGEPHRRHTRRATPGSTTYDEAAETPLDPEWDGGAWYGPSSGTYWTINPREYADPRKHGPEYLARARRAADLGDDEGLNAADAVEATDPGGAPSDVGPAGSRPI